MGSIIIHGHFYQPPRENPWTGAVDRERSALPFHDWNERIYAECYRPNAFARITDSRGSIERIVNNYAGISFNFGPTLLNWLEHAHPDAYTRILEADRESARNRQGHGNAIAQGYNHAILPLCNERDRDTQIRWGIADFRHRFGRLPESLWLPETACNDATLGALIDAGLGYVILSPTQAERMRPLDAAEWQDVSAGGIDPRVPYRYFHRDRSGRSIAIFFYDPRVSLAIAFEGALAWSNNFVDRLAQAIGDGEMVNVATDGESYGHHFPFGDRCLAYSLAAELPARGLTLTNYGEFLDGHPPRHEVEIKSGPDGEGTAWSCQHGVGRWYRDCGCQTDAAEGWNQRWRGPLRQALDLLRDEAARGFEDAGGDLFRDPWGARDAYIEVLRNPDPDFRNAFVDRRARRRLDESARTRALTLLETQRAALLMYTSCGWFFSDISRIETVQVMKYAGRVLDFMEDLGAAAAPARRFLEALAEAKSNIPALGNGADVYRRLVQPHRAAPSRIAAHLAISSIADDGHEGRIGDYLFRKHGFERGRHGRFTLTTGSVKLKSSVTGSERDSAVAALHMGGLDFYCVLREYPGAEVFKQAAERLHQGLAAVSLPAMLRLMEREFGPEEFGLEAVLPGARRAIFQMVFGDTFEGFAAQLARLYEENRQFLASLNQAGFEPPVQLRQVSELALQHRFEQELIERGSSLDLAGYSKALEIAEEVARWNYRIDKSLGNSILSGLITEAARAAVEEPSPERIDAAIRSVRLARGLTLEPNLDLAQEAVYTALVNGARGPGELARLAAALNLSSKTSR